MESGHDATGDMLQVIPRRSPSFASAPSDGSGTGSIRLQLAPPARRRKLTRVVLATLSACGLILVAAGIAHIARANDEPHTAGPVVVATAAAPPVVAPAALAPAPAVVAPETGTLRLERPAVAGKVWLDGHKITTSAATVACGAHQIKMGAHGKARAIDVPCGGEFRFPR